MRHLRDPDAALPRAPRRRQPRAHPRAGQQPPRRDGVSRPRTVGPRPRSSVTDGRSPPRRSARRTSGSGRALEAGEGRAAAGEPILGDLLADRARRDERGGPVQRARHPHALAAEPDHRRRARRRLRRRPGTARPRRGARERRRADLDGAGRGPRLFERVALSPATPPDVAMEVGYVVGNTLEPAGRRRDEREAAVARRIAESSRPAAASPTRQALLRGLVYVLGMRGRHDLVTALVDALRPRARPARDARDRPRRARLVVRRQIAVSRLGWSTCPATAPTVRSTGRSIPSHLERVRGTGRGR